MTAPPPPVRACLLAARRLHVRPTVNLLTVSVSRQRVIWWKSAPPHHPATARARLSESATRRPIPPGTGPTDRPPIQPANFQRHRAFRASTSKFGIGQVKDSQRTPLGLHRVARKIGTGWPVGTAFRGRVPVGFSWAGLPDATITHRILWLEGLDPGHNRGGDVDTFDRFIYLHGLSDEPSLGRPASHGCVHLAAHDLLPLFDVLPTGTLVWIALH